MDPGALTMVIHYLCHHPCDPGFCAPGAAREQHGHKVPPSPSLCTCVLSSSRSISMSRGGVVWHPGGARGKGQQAPCCLGACAPRRQGGKGSCAAAAGGACGAASDPRTQESLPAPDRLSPRQEGQGPRARGQRWARCSRASEAGCLPDRGILFGAAVRAPKATPGGHDGNDSRSGGPPSRRLLSLARTRAVLRGGQAPLRGVWGGRVQKGTPKILPSKGLGTEVGSQGESPSDSKCTRLGFMASFPYSGFLAFFFFFLN